MANDVPLSPITLAGMAWRALAAGDAAAAQPLAHAATLAARRCPRRERQQVQIVQFAVAGDKDRATGLIAEHLAEFPDDELIGFIQAWLR